MPNKRFYGEGIPGVDPEQLKGMLIVVEGADCSGRTTQVELLRDHLERAGHAVENVGLKRSALISPELEQVKDTKEISPRTMSLFYATDYADQLENKIIPALQAGFIVVADRYIYTLMARDIVRGENPEWLQSLYGIALIPDIVFFLKIKPERLVERTFTKYGMFSHWESGMDLHISREWYHCFIGYQRRMNVQFSLISTKYNFRIVNGNRSVKLISTEICREVDNFIRQRG